MAYDVPNKECSEPSCVSSYKPHHWGTKNAQKAGWFLQKDGTSWCPDHIPEWVAQWREDRKSK